MPAPAVAVYVVAAVSGVAAVLAFKEFVYEPHIAPRVERWAEGFIAKRQARRMRRAGLNAVPVPSTNGGGANDSVTDSGNVDNKSTYELESLVANEVMQWRSQVPVSRGEGSTLRQRKNVGSTTASALDESNIIIPYDSLTPTHILFDPADGLTVSSPTSTSTMSSRVATPSPHSTLSHSTFRTPPPVMQAPPTPEPSVHGSPAPSPTPSTPGRGPTPEQDPFLFSVSSPHHVPSLSLSHPLDLDSEHDLELLSAPSSRPSSPFSDFSSSQHEQFHSFSLSPNPDLAMLSASENGSEAGDDIERWSNADSEVSGSSWASAGVRSR